MTTDKKSIGKGISIVDSGKRLDLEIHPSQGTNKKVILQSNASADRTIVLPDSSDTLATHTEVTTVASDLTVHLNDTTDAHDASAISFAPASSGLLSTDVNAAIIEVNARVPADTGNLVDTLSSQTLQNKTISASNNTLTGVALLSTLLAKGDLYVATGPNTLSKLSIGTNGQHLIVDTTQPGSIKWDTQKTSNSEATAQVLTYGATTNWNMDSGIFASLTLTGNTTMALPTNIKTGCTYTLKVVQDATGGRTIAWNSNFKWPAGQAPVLSTTANSYDMIFFFSPDGIILIGSYLRGIA